MSVIAKNELSGNLSCFTKGSPEIIAELSNPDTVPENFNQILEKYTKDGYRVLGFSYKDIGQSDMVQEIKRENVECDLEFLGLILMKNKAKTESAPWINQLKNADINVMMATGDNMLTAISVGKSVGIIDPSKTVYLTEISDDFKINWTKIKTQKNLQSKFDELLWHTSYMYF